MKMQFSKTVRYKWKTYPPFTSIEVDEADVEGMKRMGGFAVAPRLVDTPVAPKKEEPEEEAKEEPKQEEPAEETVKKRPLDLLREQADELGIEYPINWGVNQLREAINLAEKGE